MKIEKLNEAGHPRPTKATLDKLAAFKDKWVGKTFPESWLWGYGNDLERNTGLSPKLFDNYVNTEKVVDHEEMSLDEVVQMLNDYIEGENGLSYEINDEGKIIEVQRMVKIVGLKTDEPSPLDEPNFEQPDGRGNGGWESRDEDKVESLLNEAKLEAITDSGELYTLEHDIGRMLGVDNCMIEFDNNSVRVLVDNEHDEGAIDAVIDYLNDFIQEHANETAHITNYDEMDPEEAGFDMSEYSFLEDEYGLWALVFDVE